MWTFYNTLKSHIADVDEEGFSGCTEHLISICGDIRLYLSHLLCIVSVHHCWRHCWINLLRDPGAKSSCDHCALQQSPVVCVPYWLKVPIKYIVCSRLYVAALCILSRALKKHPVLLILLWQQLCSVCKNLKIEISFKWVQKGLKTRFWHIITTSGHYLFYCYCALQVNFPPKNLSSQITSTQLTHGYIRAFIGLQGATW